MKQIYQAIFGKILQDYKNEGRDIKELIDIDSYLDFIITEMYVSNHSWGHNVKFWKPKNITNPFNQYL